MKNKRAKNLQQFHHTLTEECASFIKPPFLYFKGGFRGREGGEMTV